MSKRLTCWWPDSYYNPDLAGSPGEAVFWTITYNNPLDGNVIIDGQTMPANRYLQKVGDGWRLGRRYHPKTLIREPKR